MVLNPARAVFRKDQLKSDFIISHQPCGAVFCKVDRLTRTLSDFVLACGLKPVAKRRAGQSGGHTLLPSQVSPIVQDPVIFSDARAIE